MKKISGTPQTPLKKTILGGKRPKWAVSPRRVCATVLKFCMGSCVTEKITFQSEKNRDPPPYPPHYEILGGEKIENWS